MSSRLSPVQHTPSRYAVLDTLRGIGASQVLGYHYVWVTGSALGQLPVIYNSWISLEYFFALSGFVIALVYGDKVHDLRSLLGFAVRRFGRIWPLHFAVLMALVIMIALINLTAHPPRMQMSLDHGEHSLTSLIAEIFLLNAMGLWSDLKWNFPAWSMGAEFYVYLTFGLVCVMARPALVPAAIAMAIVGTAVLALWSRHYLNTAAEYGYFRCMVGFFSGVVAYRSHRYIARRWIAAGAPKTIMGTVAEVAILTATAIYCIFLDRLESLVPWISLIAPLFFFAFVLIFSFERGAISYLLDRQAFRHLGEISYSLYATHWPILVLLVYAMWQLNRQLHIDVRWHLEHSRLLSVFGFVLFYWAAVKLANFTYRTIEVPWRSAFAAIGRRIETDRPVPPMRAADRA